MRIECGQITAIVTDALAPGHADYRRTACALRAENLGGMVAVGGLASIVQSGGQETQMTPDPRTTHVLSSLVSGHRRRLPLRAAGG
jgi:hypothetical protein